MSNIVSYRLISSEWVIGEQVAENTEVVTLRKPRIIHIMDKGGGSYAPILIPLDLVTPDGEVVLYRHAIAAEQPNVVQVMIDKYLSETSNIEIVSSISQLGKV